ncbi:MAG: antitoxin [Bacilli bacterium]|nr:antitoxin [Bacilli bacterium]
MKRFDHEGLLLAEYQGKIFEKSVDLDYSTPIFIRRFFHSDFLNKMDNYPNLLSLDVVEAIDSINEQFGNSNYGKEKYSKGAMFWIGYFYRYVSYTREQSTRFVMKIFPYKQLNKLYYVYHTQDLEWCISNLLELNGLTEDYFDNNYRLKAIIKSEMDQYH